MSEETKIEVEKFLKTFAHIVEEDILSDGVLTKIWVTNDREDYVTHKGLEGDLSFLLERGITENIQSVDKPGGPIQIGFSPKENKWYGWSHRAIYGFTVGSTCKKGDCHYVPSNREDFIENCLKFWGENEPYHVKTWAEPSKNSLEIKWEYTQDVPNKKLRGTIGGTVIDWPKSYGKGEWVAETLDDAKQMAIDFADGVS